MKVLFVNTPIDDYTFHKPQEYETVVPIGLGYLGTLLKLKGHEVSILDAELKRLDYFQIADKINSYSPDILGINAPMPNLTLIKKILNGVNQSIFTVVGGTQATLEPKRTFSVLNPDAFVVGEGEEPMQYLVENFSNLPNSNPVKGLYLKDFNKNGIFLRSSFLENLDDYPFLDRSLFENDPYVTEVGLEATILGSRGCPYDCVFCSVPIVSGKKMRKRSIENIISEISELKDKYSVNSIRFIDDNFTVNKKRVMEFSEKLIESKLDVKWRVLSRIEAIEPPVLEKMAESGCYKLAFGIESFDPNIQDLIYKKFSYEKVKENLELCRSLGIKTKGFFTLGYPNETKEMIEKTIELSQNISLDDVNYTIVRAFEGTRLIKIMRSEGFSEESLHKFYQFESLNDLHGLSKETKEKAIKLQALGLNLNKYLKYHFANGTALNGMNINDLDVIIRKAYIDFYYKKL